MTEAEARLQAMTDDLTRHMLEQWRGRERILVIELVRALDEIAFAFRLATNRAELVAKDHARHMMLLGAAIALRPFLEVLQNSSGGVPWGPTNPALSDIADHYLFECGKLAGIRRLVSLERYGLAKTTFENESHLTIEVARDDVENHENACQAWLSGVAVSQHRASADDLIGINDEIVARIDRYTGVDGGWFIRYDPDEQSIAYHNSLAEIYAAGTPEASTFPDTARFNSRSFGSLKKVSIRQLGRVVHHVACVTRLKAITPGLESRNLLTIFARKDDIFHLWNSEEKDADWTRRIIDAFTLNAGSAREIEAEFGIPIPYYIDIGKDFVLLPLFGGLLNPHGGMVQHLRRHYRRDWDRSTDSRERALRREFPSLFPAPRYRAPDRNTVLKRADGSVLTDVDALILDDDTGELALVQLKCFDIYGRSLKERDSRRRNVLDANHWVEKVSNWVGGRSSKEVARAIGLKGGGDIPPEIVVLARHTTMFTGETSYDRRAYWFSWPRLVAERARHPQATLRELFTATSSESVTADRGTVQRNTTYDLLGLQVVIREA